MGGAVHPQAAQALAEAVKASEAVHFEVNGGRTALVSHEDADLALLRWSASGSSHRTYLRRKEGGRGSRTLLLHRVVAERMGDLPTKRDVDHINGNVLDNRRENLRVVSRAVNMRNFAGLRPNNTSGVVGVSFDKSRGKWVANIKVNNQHVRLGRFETLEAAKAARLEAERRLWGIEPLRAEAHQ
jgi:hypothetical protein